MRPLSGKECRALRLKRFCKNGHDVWECGRVWGGTCRTCRSLFERSEYRYNKCRAYYRRWYDNGGRECMKAYQSGPGKSVHAASVRRYRQLNRGKDAMWASNYRKRHPERAHESNLRMRAKYRVAGLQKERVRFWVSQAKESL